MRRWAGVACVFGMLIVFPVLSARAQDDQASVEIRDNYFSPAEVHVLEGQAVTWTNMGGAHSVTSDDGSFDSSPSCIAGLNCMAAGATFSHQFLDVGTVAYHCRVHGDAMVGKVIVDPAGTTTSSTTSTTTSTSSTTTATATTSSDASASLSSASAPPIELSEQPLPQLPSAPRVGALPRAIARSPLTDDVRGWALLAIAIAAGTTIAGIVLVRRGRVPFG